MKFFFNLRIFASIPEDNAALDVTEIQAPLNPPEDKAIACPPANDNANDSSNVINLLDYIKLREQAC